MRSAADPGASGAAAEVGKEAENLVLEVRLRGRWGRGGSEVWKTPGSSDPPGCL